MNKIWETGVIHGRFQVLHNDHMKYLLAGKERCRHLVVGITNPDPTHTKRDEADTKRSDPRHNPFTYYERYQMIKLALLDEGLSCPEFSLVPLPINMPELYGFYVPLDAIFFLTIYDQWGERKLGIFKNLGLKTEVLWRRPREKKGISGTDIRGRMIRGEPWEHLVPQAVESFIKNHRLIERIKGIE